MNRALNLLKKLSATELSAFQKFLVAGKTKSNQQLIQVIHSWEKDKSIKAAQHFEAVFPGQIYYAQQWYTLMTTLQTQLEIFIANTELRQDRLLIKVLLLRFFRKRKMQAFFKYTFIQYQKIVNKMFTKAPRQLHLAYEGQELYYDYISSVDLKQKTNLQVAARQLDVFFVSEKLKQICRAYSRQLAARESYEIAFSKEVLQSLPKQTELLEIPVIQLYYFCCKAVVLGGSIDDFLTFKHLLEHTKDGLSEYDLRDLYLMATNYSIMKHNSGAQEFGAIALNLYEKNLEKGYLLRDGVLPSNTLNNILGLGIMASRFEWVEEMIDKYLPLTPKQDQVAMKDLNLARIAFGGGDFHQAKILLNPIAPRSKPFLFVGAKSLEIKVYFELQEYDQVDRALNNFKAYLNRNPPIHQKLSAYYQSFIHLANRILKLVPFDRSDLQLLIEDIGKDQHIGKDSAWMVKMAQSYAK